MNKWVNEWKNEPVQLRHNRQWQAEVKHVTSCLRTLPTFLKNWRRIKLFLWKLISRISNVVFVLGTCIAHFNVRNLIAIRYMYNYCIYVCIYSMINKRNLKKSIYFINNSVHHVYIRHVGVDMFIFLYVLYYVTQWLERLITHYSFLHWKHEHYLHWPFFTFRLIVTRSVHSTLIHMNKDWSGWCVCPPVILYYTKRQHRLIKRVTLSVRGTTLYVRIWRLKTSDADI